jgi:hypothetical protein
MKNNPSWHVEESPWKAEQVLNRHLHTDPDSMGSGREIADGADSSKPAAHSCGGALPAPEAGSPTGSAMRYLCPCLKCQAAARWQSVSANGTLEGSRSCPWL